MRRRALLAIFGVALLALGAPGAAAWRRRTATVARPIPQPLTAITPARPAWMPCHPRPKPPDSLYSNGLTEAEHRIAVHTACACSDPHPWEFRHADPVARPVQSTRR